MQINIAFEDDEVKETKSSALNEPDSLYANDHFFGEPHCEPHTIKFTANMKKRLIEYAKKEGYTSLGPAIRDLIFIGLNYQPLIAYLEAEVKTEELRKHPIVRKFF